MLLYLYILHAGQRFTSGEYEMTAERMKSFAAEFDPQPFHLDETAARATVFRRTGRKRLAHGRDHDAAARDRRTADR